MKRAKSLMDAVYSIRIDANRRESETLVGYFGSKAYLHLLSQSEMVAARYAHKGSELLRVFDIPVIRDRGSEPELAKFFVNGAPAYVLNAETLQITEIVPADDDFTVWQLAAIEKAFGSNDALRVQSSIVKALDVRSVREFMDAQVPVSHDIQSYSINLNDLVDSGLLRRAEDNYGVTFRKTHLGRIALSAAAHCAAKMDKQNRSNFKTVEQNLLKY